VLLANALRSDGVRVVAINPGWVRTDMGGAGAPLTPAESVTWMLLTLDAIRPEQSGQFLDYRGESMPW
jgi:NAD(P)-dependent dehydrogenase (short-subunit alcohol dehydrogenase family)